MPRLELPEDWSLEGAALGGEWTARAEPAARGWEQRTRRIAKDRRPLAPQARIGNRCRGQKRTRVWVQRLLVERGGWRTLDDDPEVHHRHLVRNVTDNAEVVTDEQVGEASLIA